jgi:hypothetical protein
VNRLSGHVFQMELLLTLLLLLVPGLRAPGACMCTLTCATPVFWQQQKAWQQQQ